MILVHNTNASILEYSWYYFQWSWISHKVSHCFKLLIIMFQSCEFHSTAQKLKNTEFKPLDALEHGVAVICKPCL